MRLLERKRGKGEAVLLHVLLLSVVRNSLYTGAATAGQIMYQWKRV